MINIFSCLSLLLYSCNNLKLENNYKALVNDSRTLCQEDRELEIGIVKACSECQLFASGDPTFLINAYAAMLNQILKDHFKIQNFSIKSTSALIKLFRIIYGEKSTNFDGKLDIESKILLYKFEENQITKRSMINRAIDLDDRVAFQHAVFDQVTNIHDAFTNFLFWDFRDPYFGSNLYSYILNSGSESIVSYLTQVSFGDTKMLVLAKQHDLALSLFKKSFDLNQRGNDRFAYRYHLKLKNPISALMELFRGDDDKFEKLLVDFFSLLGKAENISYFDEYYFFTPSTKGDILKSQMTRDRDVYYSQISDEALIQYSLELEPISDRAREEVFAQYYMLHSDVELLQKSVIEDISQDFYFELDLQKLSLEDLIVKKMVVDRLRAATSITDFVVAKDNRIVEILLRKADSLGSKLTALFPRDVRSKVASYEGEYRKELNFKYSLRDEKMKNLKKILKPEISECLLLLSEVQSISNWLQPSIKADYVLNQLYNSYCAKQITLPSGEKVEITPHEFSQIYLEFEQAHFDAKIWYHKVSSLRTMSGD